MKYEYQDVSFMLGTAPSELSVRELVLHLSDVLIATPTESIDAAIEAALRGIGQHAQAACAYVMQFENEEERLICTHYWEDEASPLASHTMPRDQVQWLIEQLRAQRFLSISDVTALPPEADPIRQSLQSRKTSIFAAASIEIDDELIGYVAIEDAAGYAEEETALLLRQVGGLFASVLRRQATERALAESERQYRTLFEEASAPVLIIRPEDEVILDANPAAARMYGLSRGALRGRSLKEFTADVERGEAQIDYVLQHGIAENFETVHHRADGTPLRMLVNCAAIRYEGEVAVLCFLSDITEQKKTEQKLRESERRWRTLVENHPEPILISVDGEIRYVNEAGVEIFGAERRDEVVGLTIFDRVASARHEELRARKKRLEAGHETKPLEHRLLRLDGTERIVESYSAPIFYEGTRAAQTVIRDVTEQRLANKRFRDLLESAPDAMVIVDQTGHIVLANEQTEQLFGYDREALLGEPLERLIPERFRAQHVEHIERYFANPVVRPMGTDLELYGLHKDGTEFPVEIGLSPIETGDGILVTSAIRDITDRVEAEQELRRSKQRWRALVEHHPNAVFITIGGEVQYANPATASLFGAAQSEALIGRSVFEFMPDEFKPRIRERIAALEEGEPTPPLQHPLIGCDGETRIIEVSSVPIVYKEERAVQTVGRDVTEQHRYEQRLVEAKEEAEQARAQAEKMNRLKSAFLANMSHEIRTPLASIIGFAEALGDEIKPTGQEADSEAASSMAVEFTELIQRSGQRLLTTLNSVLDLSNLEAGTMGLRIEEIDVAHEVRETGALFQRQADEAEVHLQLDVDESLTAELDASALHRILTNLLSNAVKFTPAGGQVTVEGRDADSHVELVVEDTGIGISEAFLPELFDAFKQESTGIGREHEGAGLGLAVTKQLVTLMGGTIEVESEKGRGTCFTVRLPKEQSSVEPSEEWEPGV